MDRETSRWILSVLYINPDDPRVVVPYRLGLALNFGNPRLVTAVALVAAIVPFALLAAPIIAAPAYFIANPAPLIWVLAAYAAAAIAIRLNPCFAWSDYELVASASFGLIAAGLGFLLQATVNGPLIFWWGPDQLTWCHHLVLGPVAAVAQTIGKGAAVWLLLNVKASSDRCGYARHGLLVGLGFTALEITLIYFSVTWAQTPLESYLGVWERASSSVFHIYSSALLGLAFWSSRYVLVVPVLAVHASTDFLAGAAQSLPLLIYALQTVFSVSAICVWIFAIKQMQAESSRSSETA